MTLQIVGTGLGRTGTLSLKGALETLGFGPCHHMVEVFQHKETMPLWIEAGKGRARWDEIFAGYRSAVDYPAARFWREITAHYPDAKVIHTTRDPERWFESVNATIFAPRSMALTGGEDPVMAEFFATVVSEYAGRTADRDFMVDYFKAHDERVKAEISPDRLMIFDAAEGWAPLCDFLGVPVPDAPYPKVNTTEEFRARSAKMREEAEKAKSGS
jgi:hypothetical protein